MKKKIVSALLCVAMAGCRMRKQIRFRQWKQQRWGQTCILGYVE